MDGMYGLHTPPVATADYASERDPAASLMIPADNLIMADNYQSSLAINQTAAAASSSSSFRSSNNNNNPHYAPHSIYGSDELVSVASAISEAAASIATYGIRRSEGDDDVFGAVKAKIASHPRYPRLVQAYIDFQKVGAPPEIACLLDEIRRENEKVNNGVPSCLGADPELDEFMEMYCDILTKFKSDLSRPFDEATDFLNKIETQLSNLCQGAFARSTSDDGAVSSDEECSGGEVDMQEVQPRNEERDLKDRLLHRFGSHIGSLKMEFSKKKKKGKLPREARQTLLEWWNTHYKWPYPTEADKIALAETTGLDPRQINNWFINQRKRHWKPSENMQFALMDNLSSGHFFTDDG